MEPLDERVELFGTSGCPFTREAREHLEWQGGEVVEYDVERDPDAYARMLALTGGRRDVPVIVRGGRLDAIGWRGRSCIADGTGPRP
jgi:mycoredoxin